MGKLKDLSSVKIANTPSFVYVPPEAAYGAIQILVKPNLGYLSPAPATVSRQVLSAVLRGLRRASPKGRIVVIEGVGGDYAIETLYERHGVYDLLDEEMRAGSVEQLVMCEYPNRLNPPHKFDKFTAPQYLRDYDCVISVGAFKKMMIDGQPSISASLKNLYGFLPHGIYGGHTAADQGTLYQPSVNAVIQDVYFSLSDHIDGAVVDLTQKYVSPDWKPDHDEPTIAEPIGKVVWGDDLLAVDETACRVAGEPVPEYIRAIRQLQKSS